MTLVCDACCNDYYDIIAKKDYDYFRCEVCDVNGYKLGYYVKADKDAIIQGLVKLEKKLDTLIETLQNSKVIEETYSPE